MADIWDDPDFKNWADQVLRDMAPKMRESEFMISLWDGHNDVKLWVELGAAVYMNKPIMAVVYGKAEVPKKLRQIADEIIEIEGEIDTPENGARIAQAIQRMLGK